jgi:hypothetical protein
MHITTTLDSAVANLEIQEDITLYTLMILSGMIGEPYSVGAMNKTDLDRHFPDDLRDRLIQTWRMRHPHTRTFAPCDYWRQMAHNVAWEGVIDEDTDMPGGVLVTA